MGQVGSAQKRALVALAESIDGAGEVPFASAPGLINRGLVKRIGRANAKPNAAYLCEITDAGRTFVAELAEGGLTAKEALRENRAQQIRQVA